MLKNTDVWKGDSLKRKWMVATFSKFYGKIWVGFGLNAGKQFFSEVSFLSQQKSRDSSNGTRDFQKSPPFDRFTCLYGMLYSVDFVIGNCGFGHIY